MERVLTRRRKPKTDKKQKPFSTGYNKMLDGTSALLSELSQFFSLYSPFWKQWQKYKFNGLSKIDIYVLNALIKNDFAFQPAANKLLYQRYDTLCAVNAKLKGNYKDYQDWAILQFQFLIINCLGFASIETAYKKPITELEMHPELKQVLQRFNCKTLNLLFKKYNDKAFREANLFGLILLFKKECNNQKIGVRFKPPKTNKLNILRPTLITNKVNNNPFTQFNPSLNK